MEQPFTGKRSIQHCLVAPQLCSALCRYKLYTLAKGYNRNLTQQDVQMMACSTLLAALAIRPYDATVVGLGEEAQAQDADRRLRMATILGFTVVSMASFADYVERRGGGVCVRACISVILCSLPNRMCGTLLHPT